jgi:hypothetical protein
MQQNVVGSMGVAAPSGMPPPAGQAPGVIWTASARAWTGGLPPRSTQSTLVDVGWSVASGVPEHAAPA